LSFGVGCLDVLSRGAVDGLEASLLAGVLGVVISVEELKLCLSVNDPAVKLLPSDDFALSQAVFVLSLRRM